MYEEIENRWKQRIIGNKESADPALPARALAFLKTASVKEADGLGNDVWPDLKLLDHSAHITAAFGRIRDMALSYHSSFYLETFHKPEILQQCFNSLERMRIYYRWDMEMFGNWWDYDIGGAQALMDSLILLHHEIISERKEKLFSHYITALHTFIPVPESVKRPCMDNLEMTGANLADTSLVCLLRALPEQDEKQLKQVLNAMKTLLPFVREDDGFYRDGSFIQHHHIPYAGGYGPDLLSSFEHIVYLLADTRFSVDKLPDFLHVSDWITASFLPFLRDGEMMDMVRGRKTSRYQENAHDTGRIVMSSLLLLAKYLPPDSSAEIRENIKGQIERNTYERERLYDGLKPCQREAFKALLEDLTRPGEQKEFYRTYGSMDRVVVHRKDFSLGISMFSQRTGRFSYGNGENKKGFHACEGMIYLYTDDRAQYDDGFWPSVDSMRLSGITTDHTKTELVPWKDNRNTRKWVGGSNLLNRYGSTGMELELERPDSDLRAKKSWFVFEKGIVCLGAGITGTMGDYVETIAENRRTEGGHLIINGEEILLSDGMERQISGGCVAIESKFLPVGYYFPPKQQVTIKKEIREGCWKDINDSGNTEIIRKTFITIAISHGKMPVQASYSYVMVPGADGREINKLSEESSWSIITNTEKIQAAEEPLLGLLGINFWESGKLNGIQTDTPCSITAKRAEGKLYLGIADPTHQGTEITLILDGRYKRISSDNTIEITAEKDHTRLLITVTGSEGKTHSIVLES